MLFKALIEVIHITKNFCKLKARFYFHSWDERKHHVEQLSQLSFLSTNFRRTHVTPEFREGIVAPYANEEGKISLIRNASALNTNHTMALVDLHSTITAPTLLLWGVDDPWQQISDGELLSQEIPNAKLVRVEKASHWIPQDAPEEFTQEIVKFLQETHSVS